MTEFVFSPGGLTVTGRRYRLTFPAGRPFAVLEDLAGRRWAELALAWSAHRLDALDETASVADAQQIGPSAVAVDLVSSAWTGKRLIVECADEAISFRLELSGNGALTDVNFFAGYSSADARYGSGWFPSERHFGTLFSPEPHGPERLVRGAATSAAIDIVGGQGPGRGHWFFTPAPFCYSFARGDPPADPYALPDGPWLSAGLLTEPGEHSFTAFGYEGGEETFSFRLAYEGHTVVANRWLSPALLLMPGQADPYTAIARHRGELLARDLLPGRGAPRADAPWPVSGKEKPAWWREPIFCGWGAQVHLAAESAARAPDLSTQRLYNEFLATLASHRVTPGTVVIDDKWQGAYGRPEAHPGRWPDLKGWIAARHDARQRVLLWFKAWDPEGLPAEWCIRNAAGTPVAVDPTNPDYGRHLRAAVAAMLGPSGHDADGLKVDFTAHSPSGPGLNLRGREWGVELLHRLLRLLYEAAKSIKGDALIVAHAPNPYFADVADMVRLNDMLRLERIDPATNVVSQMTHRARVTAAACPDLLIDTDDWQAPDRDAWRRYRDAKPALGIPCLYYTTHVGVHGEALEEEDYAALRRSWAAYRVSLRSATPPQGPGAGE